MSEKPDMEAIRARLAERIEAARRPGRVQPCIVEVFLEFMADAREDDQRTMCELAMRYAEKRRWK